MSQLLAQNELLMNMVQELQGQVGQNPLAEAEMIKTQGDIAQKQAELAEKAREFDIKTETDRLKIASDNSLKATEMELEYEENVPGSRV